ncbi:MAG: glycosyl transferase family 1, partial [Gemmatimonadales bacterium]
MKILVLAPHPFFQARGTPLAVRMVLEFLSTRGHEIDVLTLHEGEDVAIPNTRIVRIPRIPGIHNVRPGFSFK